MVEFFVSKAAAQSPEDAAQLFEKIDEELTALQARPALPEMSSEQTDALAGERASEAWAELKSGHLLVIAPALLAVTEPYLFPGHFTSLAQTEISERYRQHDEDHLFALQRLLVKLENTPDADPAALNKMSSQWAQMTKSVRSDVVEFDLPNSQVKSLLRTFARFPEAYATAFMQADFGAQAEMRDAVIDSGDTRQQGKVLAALWQKVDELEDRSGLAALGNVLAAGVGIETTQRRAARHEFAQAAGNVLARVPRAIAQDVIWQMRIELGDEAFIKISVAHPELAEATLRHKPDQGKDLQFFDDLKSAQEAVFFAER